MHDTAYRIGGLVVRIYCDLADAAILEAGAPNVNGTFRDFVLPTARYTGLDIEAADGVDLVMELGPVEDGLSTMSSGYWRLYPDYGVAGDRYTV